MVYNQVCLGLVSLLQNASGLIRRPCGQVGGTSVVELNVAQLYLVCLSFRPVNYEQQLRAGFVLSRRGRCKLIRCREFLQMSSD